MARWALVFLFAVLAQSAAAEPSACAALSNSAELRQHGPLFLTSFPTAEPGPLHDVAFVYDNAVAAIALVACGYPEGAAQIGDALLVGLDHDRYWSDGRLRNGYLAGPVKDRPVKLAGWWDGPQNKWVEDDYQVGSDTGNMAWAMLALLTVYEATQAPQYRAGAERIAHFVAQSYSEIRPAGFDGGAFGEEPEPVHNSWKSTEHNTDLAAAFERLSRDTGDARWHGLARQARKFVNSMWQAKLQCFAVGTAADGHTRNRLLALDAQVWPILAVGGGKRRTAAVLGTLEHRLKYGDGYAYSEAGEGVWTEGTAQVALLLSFEGRSDDTRALLSALERNRAADGSYFAAAGPSLPTGFMLQTDPTKPRLYFHIPHLAALAWVALAEQRFNPFTGDGSLPQNRSR